MLLFSTEHNKRKKTAVVTRKAQSVGEEIEMTTRVIATKVIISSMDPGGFLFGSS